MRPRFDIAEVYLVGACGGLMLLVAVLLLAATVTDRAVFGFVSGALCLGYAGVFWWVAIARAGK